MKELEIIIEALNKLTLSKIEAYAINNAIAKLEIVLTEIENGKDKGKVIE